MYFSLSFILAQALLEVGIIICNLQIRNQEFQKPKGLTQDNLE